ncbi:MAG: PucR family transcriptional regulator [Eubacterium sp.]|nr:PucR family transcriptional regulator [Eubacterium sp.]
MFIPIEFIERELQDTITVRHIKKHASFLAFQILEPPISDLDDTVLYLCQIKDIGSDLRETLLLDGKNFLLFDNPEEIPVWLETSNFLVCSSGYHELLSYVNKLGNIFLTYNNWEQNLTQHLTPDSEYQELLNIGYELLQTPMAIMDANHQIIAITDVSPKNDTLYFCLQNGYGFHFINIINRSNPTLSEVDACGVVETINRVSGKRLRVYRIHVTQHSAYYIGFHKQDQKPFHPVDITLFDFFVKQLEKLASLKQPSTALQEKSIADLLEEIILSEDTCTPTLHSLLRENGVSDKGTWQLLCLRFTNYLKFRTTHHYEIMSQIKQQLPKCHCALIRSHIAILMPTKIDIRQYLLKLQYILITNDAICACSTQYSSLSDTKKIWNQLMFILDQQSDTTHTTILYYEDYFQSHCIQTLFEEFPKEMLTHSAFTVIRSFDRKNNTDYLRTLISYLQNNCSMAATAEILNIHRNSLLYRIRKIEELLGYEISASEERKHMLFSSFLIS